MDIQIISGFLGAGKTTFINQYLPLLKGKTIVIENEFGDISLDGSLIDKAAEVREITAGCICCTLSGDFRLALTELKESADPEHILIEPTGIGRLTDVLDVCRKLNSECNQEYHVSKCITIVDVSDYEENKQCFGEFYLDQIRQAKMLYLSHTDKLLPSEIDAICADIKIQNPGAMIYRDDFRDLDDSMFTDLINAIPDNTEVSAAGRHYVRNEHNTQEEHKDHDKGHDDHQHDHPHHHDHDYRHADDIFSALVLRNIQLNSETPDTFIEELRSGTFGRILRGKGYIKDYRGNLLYVDVTPSDSSFRNADPEKAGDKADVFVVIGCGLDREALQSIEL